MLPPEGRSSSKLASYMYFNQPITIQSAYTISAIVFQLMIGGGGGGVENMDRGREGLLKFVGGMG